MSYETSYDSSGKRPFKPNKDRGFWSNSNDFFYGCLCNAFRMDVVIGIAVLPSMMRGGIFTLFGMILNIILFAYPVVYMQSFLGQFSSSGFISAFRVAPLFKGIGYIALAINLSSLTFYAVFAGVPILLFVDSLHPTLPWSCEAWAQQNNSLNHSHCNQNMTENDEDIHDYIQIPSVEYFLKEFDQTFSFSLYGCVILVWIAVASILSNITTEKIGQMFRYSSLTLLSLLCIIFLRMMFLQGVNEEIQKHLKIDSGFGFDLYMCLILAPMVTLATFGPGWGSVLSLASYNTFKTDINKFSWLICASQLGILVLIGLICIFTEGHLTNNKPNLVVNSFNVHWTSFLSILSSLASLELPHMWTWMFLAVLLVGSFNLMIVQMFSILTAIFDEFETLRPHKKEVTYGISGILALISALFCTGDGIFFTEVLAELNIFTQGVMNLFLFVIIVWVYGRKRFQRDVEFMTSQVFHTWKVNAVRFVTPLFLALTLLIAVGCLIMNAKYMASTELIIVGVIFTFIPWLAVPVYGVFKLLHTNGSIGMRFKRYVRPTDWYPVDPEDRQRYEATIDNTEACQPLTTIIDS